MFNVLTKLQLTDILMKASTPNIFHKLRAAFNLSKKVLHQVGVSTQLCFYTFLDNEWKYCLG